MPSTVATDASIEDLLPRGYKLSFSGNTIFAGEGAPEKIRAYSDLDGLFAKFEGALESAGHKKVVYSDTLQLPQETYRALRQLTGSLVERGSLSESDIKEVAEKSRRTKLSDSINIVRSTVYRNFESGRLLLHYTVQKELYEKTDTKRIVGGMFIVTGVLRVEDREAMDEFKRLLGSVFVQEPEYEEFDVPLSRDLH